MCREEDAVFLALLLAPPDMPCLSTSPPIPNIYCRTCGEHVSDGQHGDLEEIVMIHLLSVQHLINRANRKYKFSGF